MSGLQLTPGTIGMFAVWEVIRYAVSPSTVMENPQGIGRVFRGRGKLGAKYPLQVLRGSVLGTAVGALPGVDADIAAWISYAVSKRFSRTPEKFGRGHIEGSSNPARRTPARWPGRGLPRWSLAFREIRSRRS